MEGFNPVGIGGGGTLYAPAISPHDPNLLFVACDMGGVYRSADGGETWTMLDKRQLRDAACCPVVFHPRDDRVVFVCASDCFKMSNDRGVTWSVLCADPPWGSAPCTALEIDEDDFDLLFAGSHESAYRSVDGGRSWTECPGISGSVVGIAIITNATPKQHSSLIATSKGVFRSDDRGGTWQPSDAGLPARHLRALAGGVTSDSRKFIAYVTLPSGIYRSTDEGRSWQRAADVGVPPSSSPTHHDRAAKPQKYQRIQTARYAAEIVFVKVKRADHVAIHRSDNAGATWRAVADGEPGSGAGRNITAGWLAAERVWQSWSGASWGFTVSRRDPNHALFTNAGEIYRTTDGGGTWTPVYSRLFSDSVDDAHPRSGSAGLEVTAAWQFSFDPHDSTRAYICYSDIGFARSCDRGQTWSHATRGMPWPNTVYQIAFDPAVPGLLYAACADQHGVPHWTDIEGVYGAGGVCVSRDWGATWAPIGTGLPNTPATSIVLDPRSPPSARTLHVTQFGVGVYTSTDSGMTWQPNSVGLGGVENRHVNRLKLCGDGTLYCTITGRREGLSFPVMGGLYRSRDGARTWTDVAANLGLRWPGDVDTAPEDSGTIYLGAASAPGYPQGGVYKSVDDGMNWRCILREEQFPQELCSYAHALFVTVDPSRPATVYVGATKHGLFVSHDAGTSWQEMSGIPFAPCQRVTFDPADASALWVATFGAGVWRGRAPQ